MKVRTIRNIILALCLACACFTTVVSSASAASAKPASMGGRITNDVTSNGQQFCLGITGGSTQEGAQATVWNCNFHPDQEWTAEVDTQNKVPGGVTPYKLVNANGWCLGLPGGSLNWGTVPVQWACNEHLDQDWELANFNGFYYFLINYEGVRNGSGAECLGVSGGNVYTGATPVIWGCDQSQNQAWYWN